jgi:hypothetical protein
MVFALVAEHLNEHQRRLLLGAFALVAGGGGITQVAELTGVARGTVRLGRQELAGQRPSPPNGRVRHAGGGRKRLRDTDPELVADLDRLIEPTTRGEPDSALRWTCNRDAQFAYLNEQVRQHQADGAPVLSVDTKKKGVQERRPGVAAQGPAGGGQGA